MPKKTFFNLKEEKRNLIILESKKEFANFGYYNAKIQRISNNSNISVGSFYQYFEDLDDLFFYLVDLLANRKIEIINKYLSNNLNGSFKDKMRLIFMAGVDFILNEDKDHLDEKKLISLVDLEISLMFNGIKGE